MGSTRILLAALLAVSICRPGFASGIEDLNTRHGEWIIANTTFQERSALIDADWRNCSGFTASLHLDRRVTIPIRANFHIVNSEGLYYRTARSIIVNDKQATIIIDLSDDSTDWYPVGHARPWTSFNLWRVKEVGITLSAPKSVSALVSVSGAALLPAAAQAETVEHAVYSVRVQRISETILALDFVSTYLPLTPFVPACVPAAVLTSPDGSREKHRTFLYQEYVGDKDPVLSADDLVPAGPLRWRVIWQEKSPGTYAYALSLPGNASDVRGTFSTMDAPVQEVPSFSFVGDTPLAFYRMPLNGTFSAYDSRNHCWDTLVTSSGDTAAITPAEAWYIPLEWCRGWGAWNGPGFYDLRIAYFADLALMNTPDRLPVLFLPGSELDDHGTFRWGVSPLNATNSGPLNGPHGVFLSAGALNQVSARAAYAYDRWGCYPSVDGLATTLDVLSGLAPSWHMRLGSVLEELGIASATRLLSSNRMAVPPRSMLMLTSCEPSPEPLEHQPARDIPDLRSTRNREQASHGHSSLCLTRISPSGNPIAARFSGGLSLGDEKHLAVDVKLPVGAPEASRVQFVLRDGEYGWYEYLSPQLVSPGDWNTVTAPLHDTLSWQKRGPCPDYNPYTRQDIKEVIVRIFPNAEFKGNVYIDNLRCLTLADESPKPLAITAMRVSAKSVPVWEKFEISFEMSRAFSNPFDPEIVDVTGRFVLPDGTTMSVPGFLFQDYRRSVGGDGGEILTPMGHPLWKVRFAPPMAGDYTVTVEAKATVPKEVVVSAPIHFTATAADGRHRGPVRVLGMNAFGFGDGTMMYPAGLNLRSPSDTRDGRRDPQVFEKVQLAEKRKTYQYDEYFEAFQKGGLNWARVWMCSWWLGLEWYRKWPGFRGAGYYNLANAWRLDHLVDEAGRRNIYIQLALMNHGQISTRIDHEWEYHPYNYYEPEAYTPHSRVTDRELQLRPDCETFRRPAGFLKHPEEFFTDERARRLTRNRLRYIVARWGYSEHIFAWVLSSEVEFTGEYWLRAYDKGERSPKTAAWHAEMVKYLKETDPYQHLVSTHFSHPHRGGNVWQVQEIDFIQSNAYSTFWWLGGRGMNREEARSSGKPEPSAGAPAAVKRYYDTWLSRYSRPVIVGEWGGHWMSNERPFLDAELHTGTWAMVVSPMAGATGFWWWPHVHFRDKYGLTAPALTFASKRNRPVSGIAAVHGKLDKSFQGAYGAMAYGRPDWGADCYIWHRQLVYDITQPRTYSDNGTLTITGLQPGFYQVTFWNTWDGSKMGTREVSGLSGSLEVQVPEFKGDIVVALRRKAGRGDDREETVPQTSQPPVSPGTGRKIR